jgi:hypothetical protein
MNKRDSQPVISIIAFEYNTKDCLGQYVENIVEQVYQNLGIVFADDKSIVDPLMSYIFCDIGFRLIAREQ